MDSTHSSSSRKPRHPKQLYRRSGGLIVSAIVVAIGAILSLVFFLPQGERVDTDGYQVVYLASGQAYFGKLQNTTGEYLLLRRAYTTQNQTGAEDNAQPQTSLIKLSEQVYGPQDSISLKSDQVVFWQNLKDDSKVAQAIRNAN